MRAYAGSKPSPCSTASTRGAIVYPPSRSKRSRSLPYRSSAASLESCSRRAAWSTSDCSSARSSANCPAAASQTVVAPANLPMLLEERDANARLTRDLTARRLHFAGQAVETASSCPCRFARRFPSARRRATVNVMSLNSVVAPNSTPTPATASCVTLSIQRLPVLFGQPDRQRVRRCARAASEGASGSSASFSSQRSSDRRACRRPSSAYRFESRSISAVESELLNESSQLAE